MIREEGAIASLDERKALLLGMADLRGTIEIGVAAISAYLLSGFVKLRAELWRQNGQVYQALTA